MTLPKVHSRTGSGKAGPQRAELVQCPVSPESHGFYPADESCPWCEDPPPLQPSFGFYKFLDDNLWVG